MHEIANFSRVANSVTVTELYEESSIVRVWPPKHTAPAVDNPDGWLLLTSGRDAIRRSSNMYLDWLGFVPSGGGTEHQSKQFPERV